MYDVLDELVNVYEENRNPSYEVIDFIYSINDQDFYMSAINDKGEKEIIKYTKGEYERWQRKKDTMLKNII